MREGKAFKVFDKAMKAAEETIQWQEMARAERVRGFAYEYWQEKQAIFDRKLQALHQTAEWKAYEKEKMDYEVALDLDDD
jgi:hypothetical protein